MVVNVAGQFVHGFVVFFVVNKIGPFFKVGIVGQYVLAVLAFKAHEVHDGAAQVKHIVFGIQPQGFQAVGELGVNRGPITIGRPG